MNSSTVYSEYNGDPEDAEVINEAQENRRRKKGRSKWKMRRHHMHDTRGQNPLRPWGGGAIAIMVVGFIVMPPVGFLALAYNIWGNWMFRNSYEWNNWSPNMDKWFNRASKSNATNNNAFEQYKSATLQRLEEEEREFLDFMADLRAAKDREEFDRFMGQRKPKNADDAQA